MVHHNISLVNAGNLPVINGLSFFAVNRISAVEAHMGPDHCPEISKTSVDKEFKGSNPVEYQPEGKNGEQSLRRKILIQHRDVVAHIQVGLEGGLLGQCATANVEYF